MPKAIEIGGSSGIGRELAKLLSANGYIVGVAGRRERLLHQLRAECPGTTFIKQIDVSDTSSARSALSALIAEMNGADLIVICAGVGYLNHDLAWEPERDTIATVASGRAPGGAPRGSRRGAGGGLAAAGAGSARGGTGGRGLLSFLCAVLIDDMGFGQSSTFGGGVAMPTLDRIAAGTLSDRPPAGGAAGGGRCGRRFASVGIWPQFSHEREGGIGKWTTGQPPHGCGRPSVLCRICSSS